MATSKSYYGRANYRFLPADRSPSFASEASFELDESDLYNSTRSDSPEFRKSSVPSSRLSKKRPDSANRPLGSHASSLPVNIPDWSKILREEYRENRRRDSDDDDDEDEIDGEGGVRIPPHELLARQMARTRIASFSVHEGIGRTLKGRDLSRVRNAIWAKTGFED